MLTLLSLALAQPPVFTDEGLLLFRDGPNATLWDLADRPTLLEGGPRRRVRRSHVLEPRWSRPRGERASCRSDHRVLRADADHRLVLDEASEEVVLERFRERGCRTREVTRWLLPRSADVQWADWRDDRLVVGVPGSVWWLHADGDQRAMKVTGDGRPGLLSPTDDVVYVPGAVRPVRYVHTDTWGLLSFGRTYHLVEPPRWGEVAAFGTGRISVWNWRKGELLLALPEASDARVAPEEDVVWAVPGLRTHEVVPWTLADGSEGATLTLCRPDEVVKELVVLEAGRLVGVCHDKDSYHAVRYRLVSAQDGTVREHATIDEPNSFAFALQVSRDGRVAAVGLRRSLWLVDLQTDEDRVVRELGAPSLPGFDDDGHLLVSSQGDRRLRRVEGLRLRPLDEVLPAWNCLRTPEAAWMCDRGKWLDSDGSEMPAPVRGTVLAASDEALLLRARREVDGRVEYVHEVRRRKAPFERLSTLPEGY